MPKSKHTSPDPVEFQPDPTFEQDLAGISGHVDEGLLILRALCRLALGHKSESDMDIVQKFLDETETKIEEIKDFNASH